MKTLPKIILALTLTILLTAAVASFASAQAILPKPNSLSGLSAEQQKALIRDGATQTRGGYGVTVLIPFITYFSIAFTATASLLGTIYGGVLYVSTFADETQVGKAKKILMWSLIGLAISMFSYAIVAVLLKIRIGT
jgi:hypothetical protein